MDVLEKFSTHGRRALRDAFWACREEGAAAVEPEHLLIGIARQKGSLGAELLASANLKTAAGERISGAASHAAHASPPPRLSDRLQRCIEKATLISSRLGHRYIGTEHLLAGILEHAPDRVEPLLKLQNMSRRQLGERLTMIFKSTSKFPDLADALDAVHPEEGVTPATRFSKSASALENFALDLTNVDVQGRIDPLIGRQAEVERIVNILCRRTKNNPLLLGEPGVGKTAIVEGLAKKIVQGDVPEALQHRRIWQLDLGLLVAGSSYRGEFEQRLKQLIAEVKNRPEVILFIDEIHSIVGAGSASGSMDAANLMKPSLARGEIRCIGATTLDDYKRHLEHDGALDRRFQPVIVRQPDVTQTIGILKGLRPNYERFHQVQITDEAITAAATLADRYLTEKCLPDKAIDVLDEAAASSHVRRTAHGGGAYLRKLQNELQHTVAAKRKAVSLEQFEDALRHREAELELGGRIDRWQRRKRRQRTAGIAITAHDVAAVIAKMTGVQVSVLQSNERQQLKRLERTLAARIMGQAGAIARVAQVIRRARAGIGHARRPLGSFLFLGPSGVGKTELSRVLAETVFGGADRFVRIDMSEFTESFTVSRLIGSPAGYVGYRDRAQLTDVVRKSPHCVVLFDEVEKAHPQVLNLLLQILEDGNLTDATGKITSFRHAIVILTSNCGTELFTDHSEIGFDGQTANATARLAEIERELIARLNEQFAPELINRIDQTVIFQPLTAASVAKIADLRMSELAAQLTERNVRLRWSPAACRTIASLSFSPQEGARAVRRTIQTEVEAPISELILRVKRPPQITISSRAGKLHVG